MHSSRCMDEVKLAVVIDHNEMKGQRVVKILNEVYQHPVQWERPDPQGNYLGLIDLNSDSIDLIVVANGGFLGDVLERHKKYAIPTIVRVGPGSHISPDIFAKVGNLEYVPAVMLGLEQNVNRWSEYIVQAQRKAKLLRR